MTRLRVLVLGGVGMLGHRLWVELATQHDVWGSVRGEAAQVPVLPGIDRSRIYERLDVSDRDALARALEAIAPDVVINCIGLVKQHSLATNALLSIELNSLLPHLLFQLCDERGARLVHISTDCVFSGLEGNYRESRIPDPVDLYGRSKLLGEVDERPNAITLRTSMIGRELRSAYGLVEWFLAQRAPVKGFQRAIFSGLTTRALAGVIAERVIPAPALHGVYHVSANPISKFDLLVLLKDAYRRDTEVRLDQAVVIDRSLDSSRFQQATGFIPETWTTMVARMVNDVVPYERLR